MGWLNLFSPTDAGAAADASDVTIINAAVHDGRGRGEVVMPGTLHRPDPPLPEEIKRRQVALIVRYIVVIRAR